MIRSLIAKGDEGGFLPIFPAWSSYTSEMIGDHTTAIIGDAYLKGIRGFDIAKAYTLMRRNAFDQPATVEEYKDGRGRRALDDYLRLGSSRWRTACLTRSTRRSRFHARWNTPTTTLYWRGWRSRWATRKTPQR